MRLLLLAYPGAGKGTQGDKLAAHYRIVHLSSGELLRSAATQGTKIGRAAADYMRRGDLVPIELMFELLSEPLLEAAEAGGFVLDGFPRNIRQAEAAHSFAKGRGIELEAVIHLFVGRDELEQRLRIRAKLEERSDDNEATISNRFEVFDAETRPLLDYYQQRGLLVEIDGNRPADEVFFDVRQAVDGLEL